MESDAAAVAARYARFACDEAPGRSDLYAAWAAGVADDAEMCAVIARIPASRRQPPLVFAVSRLLGAPEDGYDRWRGWVVRHAAALVAEASARMLQTNEPQRCAALLTALGLIDGPIALFEIGASAGLCLYPDRYAYRFTDDRGTTHAVPGGGGSGVVLDCRVSGSPPMRMPEVVWRGGLDLSPLDARDPGDRAFLTALVWPGETGRRERIEAALDVAASDPPEIVAGDASDPQVLRAALDHAAAVAPRGATLVVTTPGVLPHIARAGRESLIQTLESADVRWVSIDPPGLHDAWRTPVDPATWGGFVLGLDGHPLAAVDPLGAFVEWRAGTAPVGA